MRMEETRERCTELQEEEIGTLDAIYPDHLSATLNADTGLRMLDLQIPIVLPGNVSVDLVPAFSRTPGAPSDVSSTAASSSSTTALAVSHLPPISVRLTLPADYPSLAPPMITSLRATIPGESVRTAWLSRKVLQTVSDKVRQVWEDERLFDTGGGAEGLGMLWQWWEWVANGDFLQDSGLLNAEQLRLTIPPSLSAAGLFTLLNRYNAQQIHSSFESTAFACAICFESRKGKKCAQMPCGCVFCHSCLHSCWTLAITEGSLEAVSCPDPGCVKKRATKSGAAFDDDDSGVDGSLVESLVGRDLTERWQELKNRRRAEIDPTYCICPRPGCQAPVPPPAPESATPSLANTSSRTIRLSDLSSSSSSSASSSVSPLAPTPSSISTSTDDRWARYRQCPTCSYSFCLYCSATWHGPHAPCSFPQTSALVLEYLSYPPDSPERVRMEQRRGKKNIERMVGKYLEEEENKKWLDERTRACAGCGVRVEKSHGCNHMTCGRCGAHFCYRCGISIKPTDPYEHYRRPGSSCFEKLFDQEEIARFERETAMQQAGLGVQLIGDEWGPRGVWEW